MKSKIMKMMVTLFALTSISAVAGTTVKDAEGNKYPTVKIGQQIWMAKNLNVNVPGSMCYENDPANCKKYGRLYTWKAAREACPTGWHLPSKDEFGKLLATVWASSGDRSEALRAGSWNNGANKFGFSALPAGYYNGIDKKFYDLGRDAEFWSSTEFTSGYAYHLDILSYALADVSSHSDVGKGHGRSVRCLQD